MGTSRSAPWMGVMLVAVLTLAGCASQRPAPVGGWDWVGPVPDGYYLIRPGDTLSELAQRRGLPIETLARWNQIESPYQIYAGRLLRVVAPDGSPPPRPQRVATQTSAPAPASAKPSRAVQPSPASAAKSSPAATAPGSTPATATATGSKPTAAAPRTGSGVVWGWPLPGRVVQGFKEGDALRQGLRLNGRAGERVQAAADGTVVYSGGGLKGYGNLIIIKHNETYLSAYGFNRSLLVEEGARVKRGQAVAEVGQAADGGPHQLHFEIRREGTAVDPLIYLPKR